MKVKIFPIREFFGKRVFSIARIPSSPTPIISRFSFIDSNIIFK